MSNEIGSHKVGPWALAQWVKRIWQAGAEARRQHAIAVWGDGPEAAWQPRPDHLYRRVRTAWSPKA